VANNGAPASARTPSCTFAAAVAAVCLVAIASSREQAWLARSRRHCYPAGSRLPRKQPVCGDGGWHHMAGWSECRASTPCRQAPQVQAAAVAAAAVERSRPTAT
jgi:hypothetical protein